MLLYIITMDKSTLWLKISIQGEQFLLSQTIVDGIATLFLAQYETNIPYKSGYIFLFCTYLYLANVK
jgi:hypothetical protein